jgi:hypothetical protein
MKSDIKLKLFEALLGVLNLTSRDFHHLISLFDYKNFDRIKKSILEIINQAATPLFFA